MAVYLTEVVTDLAMPPQQRPIPHQFAMGDNNAYTITALLCDSRNPEAELLDGTVGGELVRPDGVTVALAGEKGDAVRQVNLAAGGLCNATPCSVTLPQACFAVPGRVTLTIKLTEGTTITQALSVSAVVVRTSTDEAVDPGEVIPDLAAIQAAAAEALDAADDATDAAADARAAASSAVRYDTAQSLTVAQKAQARDNIGALDLSDVDQITGFTDYGPVDGELESGTGFTGTIKRVGNVITLNGTAEGGSTSNFWWLRLSGTMSRFTSAPLVPNVRAGDIVALDATHRYRMRLRLVSGSAVLDGESVPVRLGMYKGQPTGAAGSVAPSASEADTFAEGGLSERDTANLQAGYSHAMFLIASKGTVFTNAVYIAELDDMTVSGGPGGQLARVADMIAPRETLTAMSNRAEGELIALNGLLYKATQAIAAGGPITPGTNVTETTVAAQLAALEARIAALEG